MKTPIFESNGLNSVSVMLDAYREELLRSGQPDEARHLKGLEIFTIGGAHCALAAIKDVQDDGEMKQYVMAAIEQAIDAYSRQNQAC